MRQQIIKGGFRARNLPLGPDYRPMYKIGIIILILNLACRGGKSSLNKLHFFIWALKSESNMAFIRWAFMKNDTSNIIAWGVEPALNKALTYATAEGLLILEKDKYALSETGTRLGKTILANKDLFSREKSFLIYIGKLKVTEDYINKLTDQLNS